MAIYLVYDNEESAIASAADDLGEKFQFDAPILGAAMEYFGIDDILEYVSGLDDDEIDDLVSLYDDLGKEEFAEYIQNRVGFDYRGFAEFNINELGPAWHLAIDGEELELPNGMLAYMVD